MEMDSVLIMAAGAFFALLLTLLVAKGMTERTKVYEAMCVAAGDNPKLLAEIDRNRMRSTMLILAGVVLLTVFFALNMAPAPTPSTSEALTQCEQELAQCNGKRQDAARRASTCEDHLRTFLNTR